MDGGASQKPVKVTVDRFLRARVYPNRSMTLTRQAGGATLVTIPMKKPNWLVPPISWIMPFSSHKRVELDLVGSAVMQLCDGKKTIEKIIETFARDNKLSFREAQLPVTQFIQQLAQRGLFAVVGLEKDAD